MKNKKILVIALTIIGIILLICNFVISSNASDGKLFVNLQSTDLNRIGYGIGNPKNGTEGNYIWSLRTYNSNSASDISAQQRQLYCIKANYGDTWNANEKNIVEYNLSYNLQEEREKLVELLGKDSSNEANKKIIELLNAETGYYKEIMWILDNAYIAGTTDKTAYLEKMGIKYDEEYQVYYYEPTNGYDYSDITTSGEYTYLLTDEDIQAVQKTAIWYYTNYKLENQEEFNLKDKVDWLTITTDEENYNQLADISRPATTEGADRDELAKILYNYLVDAAERNADQYTDGATISEPAKVNTDGLAENGQGGYKLTTRREGENYIIGPIKIDKNNDLGYEIEIKVTNEKGQEITKENYKFTDETGKEIENVTSIKDLVGRTEGFYISVARNSVEEVAIEINITYETTEKTLWLKGTESTDRIDLEAEQPVIEIEKTRETVPVKFTSKPDEFDLALRKYITEINGQKIETLGETTRVPNIDESTLQTGTTATYKHRKAPVTVKENDVVKYTLTIYNEGNKAGYASKIVDQLPTGLTYSGEATITSTNKLNENKNTYTINYDEQTNKVELINTTNKEISKYQKVAGLDSETLEIKCTVTAKPGNSEKILTNVAWISQAYDSETGKLAIDRDSQPETTPSVNKDNMENYKGKTSNKTDLTDSNYFYEGEQDDDDFEKIVLEPVTEVKVTKVWEDNNNQDGIRPTSVSVTLLANGVEKQTIALNQQNSWTYTFTNLPKYENGEVITYTVRENNVPNGYTEKITGTSETGFIITNTHTPEITHIKVTKVWEDNNNQDGIRPSSVSVTLLANGVEKQTIVLNQQNSWEYTFTNLPKYENGVEIKYTVRENNVPEGYVEEITGDAQTGFIITNTHTPEITQVKVTKVWEDNNNQDGIRPTSVSVTLLANDVEKQTIELNEGNGWKYTFTNLPKYENGKEIIYTVRENDVPDGYTEEITGNAEIGFVITNRYTPDITQVKVKKVWKDNNNQDGIRPESISVTLLANGEEKETVELNESNNWEYTFTNLPKYENGVEITYTVKENDVLEGYVVEITENAQTEFIITNTHETEETSIKVRKVWDDNNDEDGIRPDKISVTLLANGEDKETIELNESNNWEHTFTNLPTKQYGQEIEYTIRENNVPQGYVETITGDAEVGFVITNTHIPEKIFDLALRKYIIKINNNKLTDLKIPTRVPNIEEGTLQTGTTATYRHKKDPIEVEKEDIITYAITVYNEGEKAGYASQIIDQLPTGLLYSPNSTVISKDANGEDKNTYSVTYDPTTNKVIFDIENTEETPAKELQPYKEGQLDYETLEIKCKVIYEPQASGSNILTNVAWISEAYDTEDNTIAKDRDSEPETSPNVNKDNMEDYKGNTDNKDDLTDKEYFYKGEQDDDDFEKIYVKTFDLALRKFITAVNETELKDESGKYIREPQVDLTDLINGTSTTATYNHPKVPLSVKVGDTVVYTLRVYNEGEIDGYASEVTDYLPPYLIYVEDSKINEKYGWKVSEDGRKVETTYLADKEITAFDGKTLDYEDIQIECKISENAIPNEGITNIAEITEYKYGDIIEEEDIDSESDNMKDILPTDEELPTYKDEEINKEYVPGNEDDDDFEKVYVKEFDLALRKFITEVQKQEVTTRIPNPKIENGQITYEHTKEPLIVHVGDTIIYTIRVYNEGEISGYASEITDDIPEYLEYLPEESTNVEYMWKMYDENDEETDNVEDAVKVKTEYLSKENGEDNLIQAFDGTTLDYKEIKIAFKVKDPNSNEYIITNHAQISDDEDENGNPIKDKDSEPDEWNEGEDDQDIENVKVNYFDLALLKYVTKTIVIENGVEKITETGYNGLEDPEPVVKVELNKKKLDEVVVKFGFGIKITNEGDIAGYATEITDYVPERLKFDPNDNTEWTDEGNNVISTRQLEGTLLQPGESATVEVILTWINGEDNLALKTNVAEISEDDNEYDVPDRDSTPDNQKEGEDDIDEAKVILSIITGGGTIIITLILGILVVVLAGVVLIKRFVI